MRQKLEDAAIDCRSVTLPGTAIYVNQIKRIAYEVAEQFRRMATIKVAGNDVVVSFMMWAA